MERRKLQEAFRATLDHFELTSAELARGSGVREATISVLRNNRQSVRIDTLQKILASFPDDAYLYFCMYLFLDMETIVSAEELSRWFESAGGALAVAEDREDRMFRLLLACVPDFSQEQLAELIKVVADRMYVVIGIGPLP